MKELVNEILTRINCRQTQIADNLATIKALEDEIKGINELYEDDIDILKATLITIENISANNKTLYAGEDDRLERVIILDSPEDEEDDEEDEEDLEDEDIPDGEPFEDEDDNQISLDELYSSWDRAEL
ncbi:MAG: hypothetical protein MJ193_05445 [Clostridia bacterium]|nr:hypothetical protein [Clostridia bacterium]